MSTSGNKVLKSTLAGAAWGLGIGIFASAASLGLMIVLFHYQPKSLAPTLGFFGAILIWGASERHKALTAPDFVYLAIPFMLAVVLVEGLLSKRFGAFAGTVAASGLTLSVAVGVGNYLVARRAGTEVAHPAEGA